MHNQLSKLRPLVRALSALRERGRMPKGQRIPYEWYDSPNIHLTTISDFRDFCRKAGLRVIKEFPLHTSPDGECNVVRILPNLLADEAIFLVERDR